MRRLGETAEEASTLLAERERELFRYHMVGGGGGIVLLATQVASATGPGLLLITLAMGCLAVGVTITYLTLAIRIASYRDVALNLNSELSRVSREFDEIVEVLVASGRINVTIPKVPHTKAAIRSVWVAQGFLAAGVLLGLGYLFTLVG